MLDYGLPDYLEETLLSGEIFPGSAPPVIMPGRDGQKTVLNLKWGFPPPGSSKKPVINARGETAAQKPMFRNAFSDSRCLIPADAFYEWKKEPGNSKKTKYVIYLRDGEIFSMAGLCRHYYDHNGNPYQAFVIITTGPDPVVAPIHNRMPVILPRESEHIWLNREIKDPAKLTPLLKPSESLQLKAGPA